jgi:hypothetical protein
VCANAVRAASNAPVKSDEKLDGRWPDLHPSAIDDLLAEVIITS